MIVVLGVSWEELKVVFYIYFRERERLFPSFFFDLFFFLLSSPLLSSPLLSPPLSTSLLLSLSASTSLLLSPQKITLENTNKNEIAGAGRRRRVHAGRRPQGKADHQARRRLGLGDLRAAVQVRGAVWARGRALGLERRRVRGRQEQSAQGRRGRGPGLFRGVRGSDQENLRRARRRRQGPRAEAPGRAVRLRAEPSPRPRRGQEVRGRPRPHERRLDDLRRPRRGAHVRWRPHVGADHLRGRRRRRGQPPLVQEEAACLRGSFHRDLHRAVCRPRVRWNRTPPPRSVQSSSSSPLARASCFPSRASSSLEESRGRSLITLLFSLSSPSRLVPPLLRPVLR